MAKTIDAAGDTSQVETQTAVTEPGGVVGTTAYMSPEQARGLVVDKQSDIWSFGCVLYEALSGQRLFSGKTHSDVIAAILRDDPKLDRLPESTPPVLIRLIRRCLRHEPAHRLRDIGDALIEIEDALASPAETRQSPRRPFWLLAIGAAAMALVALWFATRPSATSSTGVQFQRITDLVGMEESPAISPDGKTVAFVALSGNRRQIWIKLLAGGAPLQITRDDVDREQPKWTPDSSALIYYTPSATLGEQGTLWEIPALGGTPRRIAFAFGGGDVSHDGQRIAAFQIQNGRVRLMVMREMVPRLRWSRNCLQGSFLNCQGGRRMIGGLLFRAAARWYTKGPYMRYPRVAARLTKSRVATFSVDAPGWLTDQA